MGSIGTQHCATQIKDYTQSSFLLKKLAFDYEVEGD